MQFAALKPGRRKGILLLWPQERRNFAVQGTTLAQTFGVSIALLALIVAGTLVMLAKA